MSKHTPGPWSFHGHMGCCVRALAAWTGEGPAIDLDSLRAAIAKATGESA